MRTGQPQLVCAPQPTGLRSFGIIAHLRCGIILAALNSSMEPSEDVYQNGSIITVKIKPFEQFSEFEGIEPSNGHKITIKLSDIEQG